jgi:hypothetical protein
MSPDGTERPSAAHALGGIVEPTLAPPAPEPFGKEAENERSKEAEQSAGKTT